jgi:membrane protease YdiL (CAAX protease family)
VITVGFGAAWPDLAGFGVIAGLPATTVAVIVLYAVLVNGLGEEIGWRGYALPALQRDRSPLAAVAALSLVWAGWHLPLLPLLTSFRVISGPALLLLFWLGIFTLSVVLAWIYNRSGGSILMAALFHGLYNVIAGSAAALDGLNTIFTVFLMVWAAALVVLDVRARRAGRADSPLRPVVPGYAARSGRERYSARIE